MASRVVAAVQIGAIRDSIAVVIFAIVASYALELGRRCGATIGSTGAATLSRVAEPITAKRWRSAVDLAVEAVFDSFTGGVAAARSGCGRIGALIAS